MDGVDIRHRVAAAVRQHRTGQQLSVSELARRSGVSKGTISQLENGVVAPSIETVWALSDALSVPFATLVGEPSAAATVIRSDQSSPVSSASTDYSAGLLSASPPGARRDIYLVRAGGGAVRCSEPHQAGTVEHVILVSGRATAGPAAAPVDLEPGDYVSYRGDAPHIFKADATAVAVVISELR